MSSHLPLKRPLAALLIAPIEAMRDRILTGEKKITLREGHRDYRPGELVQICCHLRTWCVQATVTAVSHCTMNDLTDEECQADGFADKADALQGMRGFYPKLTMDSPITVIRWDGVKGELVDNY